MSENCQNLLHFFDRPLEPIFMPKGDNNTKFRLPNRCFPKAYEHMRKLITLNGGSEDELVSRMGGVAGDDDEGVIITDDFEEPDISLAMELSEDDHFSVFIPKHSKMAAQLIEIFMGAKNIKDLEAISAYCQLRVNPYLFIYSLTVALLNRPDTKGLDIPPFAEMFPNLFMDSKLISRAKKDVYMTKGSDEPIVIPMRPTASDLVLEQRVAYFREDIGVNLHHWHWHLVYPHHVQGLVAKDRRGELFYYMHQQVIARYRVERICNGLGRVKRLDNLREPIEEAYFPKLASDGASRVWPHRTENMTLRDLADPSSDLKVTIEDMELWLERIMTAINTQQIIMPDGSTAPLDEQTGIDVLGNMIEASSLSPNEQYYGDWHNQGHNFLSLIHDPNRLYLEQPGVMGEPATAMRDPVFYRLHTFVDDIFALYKSKLKPYGQDQLNFPGVSVSSIGVQSRSSPENSFNTFWEKNSIELMRGLDFLERKSVRAESTYLQHKEFDYVIEIRNKTGETQMGTVRIFVAPTRDEDGQELNFDEQRKIMIEMDKFSQTLSPGLNVISRSSLESSVTIPYERTFRDQSTRVGEAGTAATAGFDFCGCGWPHHMLLPKGTSEGLPVVLFVMVSNWNEDKTESSPKLTGRCKNAASFCGIRDRKYPDRRPMGFPFDRPAPADILEQFLQPNMATQNCTINFTDVTRDRQQMKPNPSFKPQPTR